MNIISIVSGITLIMLMSVAQSAQLQAEQIGRGAQNSVGNDIALGGNKFFFTDKIARKNPDFLSPITPFDLGELWLGNELSHMPTPPETSASAYSPLESVAQVMTDGVAMYVYINFKDINRLEFSGAQYFSIDNINFAKKLSNVPDPGSFVLLGFGVIALAVVRRKASASSR